MTISIRPLQWRHPNGDPYTSIAPSACGVYRVWPRGDGKWLWHLLGHVQSIVADEPDGKAAAEADHIERIMGDIVITQEAGDDHAG